jgi:hypothetical protein
MKKQTAVEWFEDQVGHTSLMALKEWNEIFEKAKEMEKEQIIEAYNKSFLLRHEPYSTAEKYYKQKYESNTQI